MPTVQKHIAFLNLSIGPWNKSLDESQLNQADKDLIIDNNRVITFYPEDQSPTGPPLNYVADNTIISWSNYGGQYASQDHLDIKLAMTDILQEAAGATEQDKFDTFDFASQEIILKYNSISDDIIGVGYYMNEEGFDQAMATKFYTSVKLKSQQSVADACFDRFQNKAEGWFPIIFGYYSDQELLIINSEVNNSGVIQNYREYGIIGSQWGSAINGLLDYFHGSGGISPKLEDHTLLTGKTYEEARDALTEYFYQRWIV